MKEQNQNQLTLVRIAGTDIKSTDKIYKGLTEIKGISWSFSNAICRILNINKNKKVGELTEEEIKKIENFLKSPEVPSFLKNRKKDREEGIDKHLIGTDLDLKVEFDIKRMKKIKSYKGMRHSLGQPVRGQRTKSHFRKNKNKSGGGIKKKKQQNG